MDCNWSTELLIAMLRMTPPALAACLICGSVATGLGQSPDTPLTRLRPLGSPSRVDRYLRSSDVQETDFRQAPSRVAAAGSIDPMRQRVVDSQVRQTVLLQQSGPAISAPPLPSSGFNLPPGGALPNATSPPAASLPPNPSFTPPPSYAQPQNAPVPPSTLPSPPLSSGLTPVPRGSLPMQSGIASGSDFQAIPQPQLGTAFATIDNCACVTPPSGYTAASVGCGSVYASPAFAVAPPVTYAPPPAQIVPPTVLPGVAVPAAATAAPAPALFTLGQQNSVVVGQGLWGQPVAYVPGQRCRNWLRYLSP